METLPPLMQATGMLVCGEDLGMVPDCVPPVLDRLGLLGIHYNLSSLSDVCCEFFCSLDVL